MTNEQREAIDRLEKRIKDNEDYKTTQVWLTDDVVAAQAVLSLIKEQQEKIAKYEKIYKEYDCYRWVKELDKKDKQIDLMSRAIDNYDSQLEINTFKDKEDIKQYFAGLVEKE